MGFSIVSAACGAILIIFYSFLVAYSEELSLGLAAVILILAIIEFGTGIWVSICLCVMKPCCHRFPGKFSLVLDSECKTNSSYFKATD